jgi:UDP-N-acetylmuramoyl-L-alanyl-D-glutamate--2,6-diaminopimelate ligase
VPPVAAVNIDDAYGRELVKTIPRHVNVATYAIDREAHIRATNVELGFSGTCFQLDWPGGSARVETSLLGGYNVSNLLCAFAICHGMGRDLARILPRVATIPGIPGRMERIENDLGANVLVDYAHTDDALHNALTMLRAITPGRVLVVFGCGGNRDRTKRPRMTQAVQELADLAWATSDNPRKESIEQIFADMRTGVSDPARITFIEERRRAISLALDVACPGDSLLIAGKGHEPFQEFGDTVITFDDRQVARELIAIKDMRSTT